MKKWITAIKPAGLCMAGGFLAAAILLFLPVLNVQNKNIGFLDVFRQSDALKELGEFWEFVGKSSLALKVIFVLFLLIYLAGFVLYLFQIGGKIKYAVTVVLLIFPICIYAVLGSVALIIGQMGQTIQLYGMEIDVGLSAHVGAGWVLLLADHLFLLITALVYLCMPAGEMPKKEEQEGAEPESGQVLINCGEYKGQYLPVTEGASLLIGRNAAVCNLVLDGNKISRVHVEITYSADKKVYELMDYSSNGTFLKNGTRLKHTQKVKVKPGTEIYLGIPENSFKLC